MESYSNRIQFLVKKFLSNQCTAQELDELFLHINNFPDDPLLHQIIDADALNEVVSGKKLPPKVSASLKTRIKKAFSQKKITPQIPPFRKQRHLLFLKIAAVLIPAIVGLAIIYLQINTGREVIIQTSFGEIQKITLPDNSIVILNGNSTLRYPANWDINKDREVALEGEGYFKVVHQGNHKKFLVHTTNEITIEVLGTEFNVNDRKERIQIVLQSGKIKLGIDNKNLPREILMRSGDYVEVDHQGKITQKLVDAKQYTAWQNSKLVFNETRLEDIFLMLKDNYGYKIDVRDSSLLQETFTATYPADDINVLLKALSKSFKISIDRSDKEIQVGI